MKRRSERSRLVQIFTPCQPAKENADGFAREEFQKVRAIIQAFGKVGRVVRAEVDGNTIVFRARKA